MKQVLCYLIENFGSEHKTKNLDDILGPIIQTNIFRNKCFLLTCTIPIRASNGSSERQVCTPFFSFFRNAFSQFQIK